jgi:hypothetical protein
MSDAPWRERAADWKEDKSLIRAGNAPQVMPTITNLVISLFRRGSNQLHRADPP